MLCLMDVLTHYCALQMLLAGAEAHTARALASSDFITIVLLRTAGLFSAERAERRSTWSVR